MKPAKPEAFKLLHDGALAFSKMEQAGIRIDMDRLDANERKIEKRIVYIENKLKNSKIFKEWKKTYKDKANLDSGKQLSKIVFEKLGYEGEQTDKGNYKTDESALEKIDHPFVSFFLERKKLAKLLSTNFKNIRAETVDGFLHPVFNLHIARTYRSSSDSINFQNIPVRNLMLSRLVRTCFIPRKGRRLVEIDIGGAEVTVATCYHKDPVMMKYETDPDTDMHRDMAAQCFMMDTGQVSKDARYCGKNLFVFPQFYGDYYLSCAHGLWEGAQRKHVTVDEVPIVEHLRRKGIKELGSLNPKDKPTKGTFVKHIQEVENDFWGRRFKVYDKWKKRWYKEYLKNGGFITKTGFKIEGPFSRNDVINYPVQGSAFHCLLWVLINLQKELKRRKMKSIIVGQIHDSIVADVPEEEMEDYLALAKEMFVRIREEWKWIILPLKIEAEACGVGETWFDKKEIAIP